MKKILRITLPSFFLLVFGTSMMFIVTSCEPEDGTRCAVCADSSQCDAGLSCYEMSGGGVPRCLSKIGDTCSGW